MATKSNFGNAISIGGDKAFLLKSSGTVFCTAGFLRCILHTCIQNSLLVFKVAKSILFCLLTPRHYKSYKMIRSLASPALGINTRLGCRHNILKISPSVFLAHRRPKVRPISSTIRASLWSLGDNIVDALHTGTSIAILVGLGLSALPLLTGDSKERNERRFLLPNEDEGADNIRWGVMSTLAFLPFLNPMVGVGKLRIYFNLMVCNVAIYTKSILNL